MSSIGKAVFKFSSMLGIVLLVALQIPSTFAHAHTTASASSRSAQQAACLQPPRYVNVNALTDTQLSAYGLPPHAMIKDNPTSWARAFTHMKHRSCGAGSARPSSPKPYVTTVNTLNWAGNEATQNYQRGVFRSADAFLTVPSISLSDHYADVSVWPGVGGDVKNGVLVQAGVDVYPAFSGSSWYSYQESWWEVYPYFPSENLPLTSLTPGDQVQVDISSNENNDGYDYFFIEDITTGDFHSCTLSTVNHNVSNCPLNGGGDASGSSAYNSDSASGECIVERSANDLAHFNPNGNPKNVITIDSCDPNGTSIGSQPHIYDIMVNNFIQNTPIATCGPIFDSDDFTVNWLGSGA